MKVYKRKDGTIERYHEVGYWFKDGQKCIYEVEEEFVDVAKRYMFDKYEDIILYVDFDAGDDYEEDMFDEC